MLVRKYSVNIQWLVKKILGITNKYKSLYKNNIIVVIKNITFIFRGYIFLKIEKMFFLFWNLWFQIRFKRKFFDKT